MDIYKVRAFKVLGDTAQNILNRLKTMHTWYNGPTNERNKFIMVFYYIQKE